MEVFLNRVSKAKLRVRNYEGILERGLLGKEVGDVVKIQIPGGTREMEILKLKTIHDLESPGQ